MARRKNDFREEDKIKVLLWCGRHCCLCNKFVGVGIEVAHLEPGDCAIDNAMPLCFECHAAIGHYNPRHALGPKYAVKELKARGDQVYGAQTVHLVPPISYRMFQGGSSLPTVKFEIVNLGGPYPAKARIVVTLSKGSEVFGPPATTGHYDGRHLWNLNPGEGVTGRFELPQALVGAAQPVAARVDLTVVDVYERAHPLLPIGFILAPGQSEWYSKPAEELFDPRKASTVDAGMNHEAPR